MIATVFNCITRQDYGKMATDVTKLSVQVANGGGIMPLNSQDKHPQ